MADSQALTQKDLISRLLANLPAGYTTAKVKLPNAPFTTPKKDKWLRATVLFNESENVTPDEYKRTFGLFVIDSFFPRATGEAAFGDQQQLVDCELLKTVFQNEEFGNVKTQATSIQTVGDTDSWYMVSITTSFYQEGV